MQFILSAFLAIFSFQCFAITSGSMAPDFKLPSASGKEVRLSDYKGKIVVLEWMNHGCPFVRKQYDSGNMQALQKKYTAKDVVWLSIISSAEGNQGYVNAADALKEKKENFSVATNVLLDPTGDVGRMYEAKTTPHMYIVDKAGTLVYQGAIDSIADANKDSVKTAKNYVASSLDELMAGKKVSQPATKSYGCGVKYK